MKSIFRGWRAKIGFVDPKSVEVYPKSVEDGWEFKAHDGDKVKKILAVKKLTPQFDRA